MSPVIIAKKVAVNSPYFMSIHAAQNDIGEGDGAVILPLLTPSSVVLGSGTVAFCNLHLPYTDIYVYHIVYSQHFLIECAHLFFSSETRKMLKGNRFYNCEVEDWKKKAERWISCIGHSGFKYSALAACWCNSEQMSRV